VGGGGGRSVGEGRGTTVAGRDPRLGAYAVVGATYMGGGCEPGACAGVEGERGACRRLQISPWWLGVRGAARVTCVEGRGSCLGGVGLADGGCAELAGARSAGGWGGRGHASPRGMWMPMLEAYKIVEIMMDIGKILYLR
jgi:hypothetical protein